MIGCWRPQDQTLRGADMPSPGLAIPKCRLKLVMLARCRTLWLCCLLLLPAANLHATTIYVGQVTIVADANCPTGFAATFNEGPLCIANGSLHLKDLHKYVGKNIKIGYQTHQSDRGVIFVDLWKINPKQAVGTTYEFRIGLPGLDDWTYTPPVLGTAVAEAAPSSSPETGEGYVNGLEGCVTSQYITENTVKMFSYRNNCGQKINLRFVAIDGAGGSLELLPGQTAGTGDEPSKMVHRVYSSYACPAGYVAVDQNGGWFTLPVVRFRCKRG